MVREDTFEHAHQYLMGLTDEELKMRFWDLTQEIVDPLVELARTHTSPSIERSVLMRMGIDTPTCVAVVAECEKRGLLGPRCRARGARGHAGVRPRCAVRRAAGWPTVSPRPGPSSTPSGEAQQ